MIIDLLAKLIIVLILLSLYAIPIVIIVLIVKAIKNKNKRKFKIIHGNKTLQYKPGYKWNENSQRWETTEFANGEIRIERNGPTFEEWKAERTQPKTSSTYSYAKTDLPKEEYEPIKSSPNHTSYETYKAHEHRPESKPVTPPKPTPEPTKEPNVSSEYQGAYRAASILTKNESNNYKVLKTAADRKRYTISVKMRLADLVTPTASRYDKSYMSYFGKIKAKHVDFVVFDEYMRPKAIIELDDSSHDRKDRQERDKFVDSILTDAGYKVIHTRYIWPDILDNV